MLGTRVAEGRVLASPRGIHIDEVRLLGIRPFGPSDAEPLASSIRLRVNHRPGPIVVDAYFAPRPLSAAAVRAALERGAPLPASAAIADHQQLRIVVEP